jgi:hypothetical protein
MALRVSESIKIGPFRVRLSAPVSGKGRTRVSAGTRIGRAWFSVSEPVGKRRRR